VARVSKTLYDNIDVENLFSQWHPDIRRFIEGLDESCVLEVIKNCTVESLDPPKFNEVLNLTNTENCKKIFDRILTEKNVNNFISILEERDNLHPRDIHRGFSIKEIYESVVKNNYHPILFLKLYDKYYIIDGRTRFYCCLFLNVPAKIRILSDEDINESCKK